MASNEYIRKKSPFTSMKENNPRVDTALHILKGAVRKNTGSTLTTSLFIKDNKGRLTVEIYPRIRHNSSSPSYR